MSPPRKPLPRTVLVARAAKAAAAQPLAVVSVHGADPAARISCTRVKGEMQASVAAGMQPAAGR